MNTFIQFTHLVYQFGPFAFAIFFLIVMARWGQSKWHEASIRLKPPATAAEKNTYLCYFVGVTVIGVILVALSVVWWWYHRPVYIYDGQIEQVSETESIEGAKIYVRNEWYPQDPNSPQFRDLHFMVVQDTPFNDGDIIRLRHYKDRQAKPELVIKVKRDKRSVYTLKFDENTRSYSLADVTDDKDGASEGKEKVEIVRSAYAGPPTLSPVRPSEAPAIWRGPSQFPALTPPPAAFKSNTPYGIGAPLGADARKYAVLAVRLQEPNLSLSREFEVLDELAGASSTELQQLFGLRALGKEPLKEPFFVTLMDLTRHTDKEVAARAQDVVSKAPLPTEYFVSTLANDPSHATDVYLRLEPYYASAIVRELEKQKVNVTRLKNLPIGAFKRLVPTATAKGDRYYMQSSWPTDARATRCMREALADDIELVTDSGRSIEDTAKSGYQFADHSDKFKILKHAASVEKCGGKVIFVGFYIPS